MDSLWPWKAEGGHVYLRWGLAWDTDRNTCVKTAVGRGVQCRWAFKLIHRKVRECWHLPFSLCIR